MKMKANGGLGLFALVLVLSLTTACCRDKEEEELNRQIQAQVGVIEKEVKAMEAHQQTLRGMIADMQTQLNQMEQELEADGPRIHAANGAVSYLRELTTIGFGETPAHYTLRTSHNWGWTTIGLVTLFLFILWLFYRLRHRKLAP